MPAFLTSSPTSLLILTSVTGVLAAIAIPNFKKARSKAQGKACMANMRTIEGATEMYMMDNDENAPPVTLQLLVEGKYLRKEPTCSQGGEYSITKGDKYYECKCSVHGGIK
jgi:competence protein ComGC